jgi:indolepyruvate ferredoxin oxidoreductase beta subunit
MERNGRCSFVLVGVGGQGILLASNIVAEVGLAAGYDVKKSEVHGMSQRGGSVVSHVRWDRAQVFSPLVGHGEADVLLAFERMEALRFADFVRPGGTAVVNETEIVPITVSAGDAVYPAAGEVERVFAAVGARLIVVPGERLAGEAGTVKAANVVMLGAMASALPFTPEMLESVIRRSVPPKTVDVNLKAFHLGRAVEAVPA